MKKVAIITMTGGTNFGNALQNYAVKRLVEKAGYIADTVRINTQNGSIMLGPQRPSMNKLSIGHVMSFVWNKANNLYGAKNDCDFFPWNIIKGIKNIDHWNEAKAIKRQVFAKFQSDELNYTDTSINCTFFDSQFLSQYSAFVTGSDQVWNPYYRSNSFIEFLQMVPKDKRIAFAPSFGISRLPDWCKKNYAEWINEIPYLSVREVEGAKIIKELTNRSAEVLFDPTFGLSVSDWTLFEKKPSGFTNSPGDFVISYFLGNRSGKYTHYIRKYAKKNNLKVIDLIDIKNPKNYMYSPQEFVWLIHNSRAIFTDSFHGCAFSINLNKPFVAFDRIEHEVISQSSRISTLLHAVRFENRYYKIINLSDIDNIDFSYSNHIITNEREKIVQFLIKALSNAVVSVPYPNLAPKMLCTGCGACANACVHGAITMEYDNEGFKYPIVKESICQKCYMCEKACPINKNQIDTNNNTEAYCAFSKKYDVCEKSSSGGVFYELASSILRSEGIVYGAGYKNDFTVHHVMCRSLYEIKNVCTSKYVQSDTEKIYENVKKSLQNGKRVLFSGTPCQIAALRGYLGDRFNNDQLILVDIVCHGVPSTGLWKKYLEENSFGKQIDAISFRDKKYGWRDFSLRINYSDGTESCEKAQANHYMRAFLSNLSLRPSCYVCQFKGISRCSDLTIADYWGVETIHPEYANQEGVSLVLVHTDIGKKLLLSIEDTLELKETQLNKAISMNTAALVSVQPHPNRVRFFESIKNNSVNTVVDSMLVEKKSNRIKRRIKKGIKRIIRIPHTAK